MKTIHFIFFTLISLISFCQSPTYEIHSDVWEYGKTSDGELTFKPKGKDYFQPNFSYIKNKIDSVKIEKNLLQSFNEFRKSYGSITVKEDKIMSNECKKYSKKLVNEYKHDKNISKNQSEVICHFSYVMLGVDTTKITDFNKTVADCLFDSFANSKGHMDILLNNDDKYYGFGFTISGSRIYICIRSRE